MSQRTKHVVVLSGAGISAESGIKTFRDAGGLWEGHRVEDVATPEAWQRNPQLVLDFYNQLIVVGTSLFVYPAAGLATCVPATAKCYLINPEIPTHFDVDGFTCIEEKAGVALPQLVRKFKRGSDGSVNF